MSKFTPLIENLSARPKDLREVRLTFAEIEKVIGQPLPGSAAEHWYWHGRGYRPHVDLLADAGWSAHLDPKAKTVGFRRLDGDTVSPVWQPVLRSAAGSSVGLTGRDDRVRDLTQNLRCYVEAFTRRQQEPNDAVFTGPSVYFHKRTLQRLACVGLDQILSGRETEFFELLYATLVSWGMYRMGPGGAKLVGFDRFRSSILDNAGAVRELRDLSLSGLDDKPAVDVAAHLVSLMDALSVSRSKTRMVACSKTLHHLLPKLVPPMDREYTLWFFYAPTNKTNAIDKCFPDVYRWCAAIAAANRDHIEGLVGGCDDLASDVFNTSETKLIDNAIVEYVLSKLGKRPRGGRRQRNA